jgi:hypothetical protein
VIVEPLFSTLKFLPSIMAPLKGESISITSAASAMEERDEDEVSKERFILSLGKQIRTWRLISSCSTRRDVELDWQKQHS